MTVEINFAHVCDYASFSEGGKLNVLGIFKNINVAGQPPYIHPQMFIVANFKMDKIAEYKILVELTYGEGEQKKRVQSYKFDNIIPNQENHEIGIFWKLNNVKFDVLGQYKVVFNIDDVPTKELYVEVKSR